VARRPSKHNEAQEWAVLGLFAVYFAVATAVAFVVVYSDEWLRGCPFFACGDQRAMLAMAVFVIFDALVFLAAVGGTAVMASRGWWRLLPPIAGINVCVVGAAIVLILMLGVEVPVVFWHPAELT
jgi:hypothetical protein